MMTDSSIKFEITEFVNKCIQNGELTKDNYANIMINAVLLRRFIRMKETGLPRPKLRKLWDEVIKKQMLANFNVSIDKPTMNEQKN